MAHKNNKKKIIALSNQKGRHLPILLTFTKTNFPLSEFCVVV